MTDIDLYWVLRSILDASFLGFNFIPTGFHIDIELEEFRCLN